MADKMNMSIKELADYLGIGLTTLYLMRARHKIPFNLLNGKVSFYKPVIDQWLKDTTIRSAEDEMRLRRPGLRVVGNVN